MNKRRLAFLPALLLCIILLTVPAYAALTLHISVDGAEPLTLENVEPGALIGEVKTKIQKKTGALPENMFLYYNGKPLEEGNTLADYNVQDGATLLLKSSPCTHRYENGVCTDCSAVCPHDTVSETTGACDACGTLFAARVGETEYPTLAEAVNAAQSGGTVTLLRDITLAEGEAPTKLTGTFTIDLNAHTLSRQKGDVLALRSPAVVTIRNGSIREIANGSAVSVVDGATAYIESGNYGRLYGSFHYNTVKLSGGQFDCICWGRQIWLKILAADHRLVYTESGEPITLKELEGKGEMHGVSVKPCPHGYDTENVTGKCVYCDHACEHNAPKVNDACSACGTAMLARVDYTAFDGAKSEGYTDLQKAIYAAQTASIRNSNVVLTLLRDHEVGMSRPTVRSGTFTIDLNGHTLKTPDGWRSEVLWVEDGRITFRNGTVRSGDPAQLDSFSLWASAGTVRIESGVYEGSLSLTNGASAVLTGGKFSRIERKSGGAVRELLGEERCFVRDDAPLEYAALTASTIENVSVAVCSHSFVGGKCRFCNAPCTNHIPTAGGVCKACGASLAAAVRTDSGDRGYTDVGSAIGAANGGGGTLRLLRNSTDDSIFQAYGAWTFDLSGFTMSGTLKLVSDPGEVVTLRNSSPGSGSFARANISGASAILEKGVYFQSLSTSGVNLGDVLALGCALYTADEQWISPDTAGTYTDARVYGVPFGNVEASASASEVDYGYGEAPKLTVSAPLNPDAGLTLSPEKLSVLWSFYNADGLVRPQVNTKDAAFPLGLDSGRYTVVCEVSYENYRVERQLGITVQKKDIAGASAVLGDALVYTGAEQTQTVAAVTLNGMDVPTYTVSGNTATDAGEYTLTVTGTGSFTGTIEVPFTVARKRVTASVRVSGGPFTYTGAAITPPVEAYDGDAPLPADEYTVSYRDNVLPGAAGVTLADTGRGNYEIAGTGGFVIGKAAAAVKAADRSIYTGAAAPELSGAESGTDYTVSGLLGEDTLEGVTISLAYAKTPNTAKPGTTAILVTVAGEDLRYEIQTENGTLTVKSRPAPVYPTAPAAKAERETKARQDKLAAARRANADTAAWLYIPAADIDEPLLRSEDGEFYLTHDKTGRLSEYGALFADPRAKLGSRTDISRNVTVYGYADGERDAGGKLFSRLFRYLDAETLEKEPYIYLTLADDELVFRIAACFETEASFDYTLPEWDEPGAWEEYLSTVARKNLYEIDGGELTKDDTLLTLTTFFADETENTETPRLVIVAKLLPKGAKLGDVTVKAAENPEPPQL